MKNERIEKEPPETRIPKRLTGKKSSVLSHEKGEKSSMFLCFNCALLFEEPKTIINCHDWLDDAPCESISVCPGCRDTDYEAAAKCARCGEHFAKSELNDGWCKGCDELLERLFITALRDEFDETELARIKEKCVEYTENF